MTSIAPKPPTRLITQYDPKKEMPKAERCLSLSLNATYNLRHKMTAESALKYYDNVLTKIEETNNNQERTNEKKDEFYFHNDAAAVKQPKEITIHVPATKKRPTNKTTQNKKIYKSSSNSFLMRESATKPVSVDKKETTRSVPLHYRSNGNNSQNRTQKNASYTIEITKSTPDLGIINSTNESSFSKNLFKGGAVRGLDYFMMY